MKNVFFILFLAFCALANAQELQTYEYNRLRIGFEAGLESFFGSNIKPANIRESQSYYRGDYYYDDYYGCGYLYIDPNFTRFYIGVKPEYSLGISWAVAAGARFSFGNSTLSSDRDYFLWNIAETDNSVNYVRINKLNQNVYNIGIPLEVKYFTGVRRDYFVRQYFKAGFVLNYTFADDVSVDFVDARMNKYADDVRNQFDKPNNFNGQFILGIGLKIGRMRNPLGTVEFYISNHLSDNMRLSSLFKMNEGIGIGLQTTFYLPVGKQKLSYQYR
ncbi:MAG: hypothetical protein LBH32_13200 [Dysgonamonadaceae bacterium]|jgi:hypothetical protein|nr:hypothetical protein [Dysgonamonadaceae bacterium]